MAYTKTVWVDGQAPAINAANLNKIEQGISDATQNLKTFDEIIVGTNDEITAALNTVLSKLQNGEIGFFVISCSVNNLSLPGGRNFVQLNRSTNLYATTLVMVYNITTDIFTNSLMNGTWQVWKKIITEGNIGSQSVLSATNASIAVQNQNPGLYRLRNNYFSASDSTPDVNADICWIYG